MLSTTSLSLTQSPYALFLPTFCLLNLLYWCLLRKRIFLTHSLSLMETSRTVYSHLHRRVWCSYPRCRTFSATEAGVKITFKTVGNLFSLRRLQAITKVEGELVLDLHFADDYAFKTTTEAQMQLSLDCFSISLSKSSFTISTQETGVMHQQTQHKLHVEPTITAEGELWRLYIIPRSSAIHTTDLWTLKMKSNYILSRFQKGYVNRCKRGEASYVFEVVLHTELCIIETWTVSERHVKKKPKSLPHKLSEKNLFKIPWSP